MWARQGELPCSNIHIHALKKYTHRLYVCHVMCSMIHALACFRLRVVWCDLHAIPHFGGFIFLTLAAKFDAQGRDNDKQGEGEGEEHGRRRDKLSRVGCNR